MTDSTHTPPPLLAARGLVFARNDEPVFGPIDFEVGASEALLVQGGNGAGKTTLLRVLSRLLPCTGTLRFNGQDLAAMTPDEAFGHGLVQVPEGRQLFDRMTVQDNLLMGAYRRRDKAAVARDLERMVQLFPRLGERRRQLAGSMSGGEQQMCAMARALMAAPVLMMIDEMSLGLAPVIVDQLTEVLAEIRNNGVTVLLVEQDVQVALRAADRAYVIENGRVTLAGAARELIDDPAVQQAYLGV